MSQYTTPVWSIDGITMPVNPTTYDMKWDNANVTYEIQADGRQVRVQPPIPQPGGALTLTWKYANRRLLNYLMQFHNTCYPASANAHKVANLGIQPPLQQSCYFDTPEKQMSEEIFDTKFGEGGVRNDLTLTLRTDTAYMLSYYPVPAASMTQASYSVWFKGPVGNGIDGIQIWNGSVWNVPIASGSVPLPIQNLGTAPWNPVIRVNGPFTAFTLTQTYADLDGTGAGCAIQWTGSPIAAGSYLLFDTQQKRVWTVIGGVKAETYTFKCYTVSDGNPAPFWPAMNPGVNYQVATVTGYSAASTSVDFSNGSTENFRYWG